MAKQQKQKLHPLIEQIIGLLEANNMNASELADKTGIQPGVLSNLFAGKRPDPRISSLDKLAKAFGYKVVLESNEKK